MQLLRRDSVRALKLAHQCADFTFTILQRFDPKYIDGVKLQVQRSAENVKEFRRNLLWTRAILRLKNEANERQECLFERDPTSIPVLSPHLYKMWAEVYAWSGYCKQRMCVLRERREVR